MRRTRTRASFGAHLVAVVLILGTVLPFLWMLVSSFKTPSELNGVDKRLLPSGLFLGNYTKLLDTNFLTYFGNSVIVAAATTIVALLLAILAGYGFARFTFIGNRGMLLVVVAAQMFPAVMLAIPLFITVKNLGLLDSLVGLVVVYVSFALPFCIWLMRNYFLAVPVETEEAALIDGCTRFRALWRVVLPPALPGVMAAAVFTIIQVWEEFLYANTFIDTDSKRTLSVGLNSLIGEFTTDWGRLLAAGVLVMIPVLLIFGYLQRYVTQIAGGGVKG
ncbi:binding-protein-dependent transport systems inner membrane component [Beutenbergia cavernae DSM 12333]|uniref:Binding-protein-dependent transport systems inner membrane component n=1 Tax=Beutenbergia cavernae (strain ATCC BAA-8 / DSM 12333 / CCUG 43141 / JCM 11478 / NBRC 16432 / NCIMB 13614 / HKI 0122) TaxID=471853 RepID=C5C425_BEUC1|nr:carbohydrate ABC transporter permease [Beutenbergia cavernae]ACQ79938.1 binding-protein-dependent transport systems inner membrane component [Beutenbergia cavernae DSM 12333]